MPEDDGGAELLERADQAIAEAKKLREESESRIAEAQRWLQRLYWLEVEMSPLHPGRKK